MSKEYDDEEYMKENTEKSSDGLRFLASVSLIVHLFFAVFIGALGVVEHNSGSILHRTLGSFTLFYFIVAGLVAFAGFVSYVLISAIATLIENSDRTEVVAAIDRLTVAVSDSNKLSGRGKLGAYNRAMDVLEKKASELNESEELPPIDIGGFKD